MGDEGDRNPSIRASDAERSRTVQRLERAQEEGRLSIAEYDDRLQRAYAAVLRADLDTLTDDLPETDGSDRPARATPETGAEQETKWHQQWRSWAGTSVLLIGIWGIVCLAAGELTFFWPMFPVGIWGLVLLTSSFDGSRRSGRKGELEE